MKKHIGKKSLSLLLAVLMLVTAIPLVALPAAAASGTISKSDWALVSSNANRADSETFTVCSDGAQGNTTVGFIDFDISGITQTVNATLNISAKSCSGYNGEAYLEIFSISPSKRPAVSGKNSSAFSSIFNGSTWATNSSVQANAAKSNLGVSGQPAIAVIRSKEMDNNATKAYSFDISEAVNAAVRAGQSKLCLAFLNPKSYKGSDIWSDINVYYNNASITYTSGDSTEVSMGAAVTLYTGSGSTRGTSTSQTICADGSAGNTTAVFVKFPLSSVPSTASTILLSTSAWRASSSNTSAVAEVYSVTKYPAMSEGTGDQTTQYFTDAFGSGTPDISAAKTYFGAGSCIGTIKTADLSTSAKTVTIDVTSAVKEAIAAGKSEVCLMFIDQQNYNGSSTNNWSDIYLNPQQTKLIASEDAHSSYGNFNSGLYYVKLTVNVTTYWDNNANKTWVGFYYKTLNGTGAEEHLDMPVEKSKYSTTGYKTFEFVLDGFPTRVDLDCTGMDNAKNIEVHAVSLEVGPSAGNYTKTLSFSGGGYLNKYSYQNQNTRVTVLTDLSNDQYPYASTFDWFSPSDTFVPKADAENNNVYLTAKAKDQYGVVMGTEYSATMSRRNFDNTADIAGNSGITATKTATGDFTITVTEDAKVQNVDFFKGKASVSVADANDTYGNIGEKLFTIENQTETVTLDPNGGSLGKTSYEIYYGSALNAQINTTKNGTAFPPSASREGYGFKGFSTLKNGTNIVSNSEVIYTDTNYYAQWDINTYTVKFYGADGNPVSTQTVNHGESAKKPADPTKAYDETNHYTFSNWDTDYSSVKSNLDIKPVFTATPHTLVHYSNKDIAATCENDGKYYYKCNCGYEVYKEGDKASGHDLDEVSRVEATCTANGTIYYECKNCDFTKTETIAALEHDYEEKIVREATCTTDGLKRFVCKRENCGYTDTSRDTVIDALDHDWTDWETTKEATCGAAGSKRRHCKRTGCEFNSNYQTEAIDATGHDWSTEVYTEDSTCLKEGYTYNKCLNAGCTEIKKINTLPLGDHQLGDWTERIAATCTADGKKVQVCSVCKKDFNETTIPLLGHEFKTYSKISDATCLEPAKERATCTRCTVTDTRDVEGSVALGHEFLEKNYVYQNDAKCGIDGTEICKCSRCPETDTRSVPGTALEHEFTNYIYNKDATCTADGTKTAKCNNCSATDTVTAEGTMTAHKVASYTYNNDATCTADGTKTGLCSGCEKEITVTAEGTMIPHSFTNYTPKEDATCLADATEEAFCDYNCGTSDLRAIEGTRGVHTFPDPVTEKDKYTSNNDATCLEKGTMSAYCTVCHVAKTTVTDEDSVMNHRIISWISDGNATCTADGTKHGTCIYCGVYTEENVADVNSALGHWFRDYVYDDGSATCIADGTRTAVCERCDATETITAAGTALGHEWSSWVLTGEDADCTKGGTLERHCLRDYCDVSETKEVGALGHDYKWQTTESSGDDCEVAGERVKVCTVCGHVDETSREIIPGTSHNYNVSEFIEATCTAPGKRVVSCTVCGKVYSDEVIPATGHLNYSLDKTTVVAATCKAPGYTGDQTCDVCGEVVVAGTATPISNVHTYTNYVVTTQATCTANAIETASCDVCGASTTSREVAGSANGHSFTNYVSDNNATCTGVGTKTAKCDNCDATDTVKVYDSALGHDWSEWETITPASCSEKGLQKRTCQRVGCGITVTQELRKLSHKESEWIVDKEATCKEEGHRYKNCTAGCGYIFKEETIAKKDHEYVMTESTASCVDDGFTSYACKNCGATKKGEVTPALGHSYGDWVVTKQPTCTKTGSKTVSCTRCGIVLATETIKTTPHIDGDDDGYCDDCGTEVTSVPVSTTDCGCICHKTNWFMRVLYRILRFFWKLFGLRSECPCGAVHY